MLEHLLSPLRIGTLELRNRIAMAAMGVEVIDDDGIAREPVIRYYEERARGGAGLLITEVCAVAYPSGANSKHQLAISRDEYVPGLRQLTDRVHEHGAKIAVQMVHHGKVSRLDVQQGREVLMPSEPRFHGSMDLGRYLSSEEIGLMMAAVGGTQPKIKVATPDDLGELVETFASAAERAQRAGFDGVELHAAHGYLLSEFLSPAWNHREDEYGGPIENRARLLCEVLRACKERTGGSFPVWCRIDAKEFRTPGGITFEDAQRTAELAVEAGADAIHVTAYADSTSGPGFTEGPLVHQPGGYAEFAAAVKKRVSVPVIAVGRLSPEAGNTLVREGKADMIAMGRQLLADPLLPLKLAEGRAEDVRPCIYCYTCVAQPFFDRRVRCAVNPVTAHETERVEIETTRAADAKRVLIVGGGTAGLEAARVAALRGHDVTLVEKSEQLGGTLRFAALVYEPNEQLLRWLEKQVRQLPVALRLGTAATPELVREIDPEVIFVASGAKRERLEIPGIDRDHVFDGDDLRALLTGDGASDASSKLSLVGRVAVKAGRVAGLTSDPSKLREASKAYMPVGGRVAVIGGGLVGCELAEFFAERGREVTVLEEAPRLGLEMAHPRRARVLEDLEKHGVALEASVRVTEIAEHVVNFQGLGKDGTPEGEEREVEVDTVVIATGLAADLSLAEELAKTGVRIETLGDASGVGYIEGAILDGFKAAAAL